MDECTHLLGQGRLLWAALPQGNSDCSLCLLGTHVHRHRWAVQMDHQPALISKTRRLVRSCSSESAGVLSQKSVLNARTMTKTKTASLPMKLYNQLTCSAAGVGPHLCLLHSLQSEFHETTSHHDGEVGKALHQRGRLSHSQ